MVTPTRVVPLILTDSEAKAAADLWGSDPVHPGVEAYEKVAAFLEADLANTEAKYPHPPASTVMASWKKPRVEIERTG